MGSEIKYIPTQTDVTKTNNSVTIHTYYVPEGFGTDVYLFISDTLQNLNGVNFQEGYEGVVNNNFDGDFYLDSHGNLIVDSPYSENLEIDDSGNVILTI